MTDLLPSSFYMWGASEGCLTAGYWSYDPPTGGGNPTTRFVALVPGDAPTHEALAASPEVAKLVADAEARAEKAHEKEIAVWAENYAALERRMVEAEARGMERALETMKTTGDSAVTEAMGQRLCCNGQDCGCHGATVEQYLEHLIRAEAATLAAMTPEDRALCERSLAVRDAWKKVLP